MIHTKIDAKILGWKLEDIFLCFLFVIFRINLFKLLIVIRSILFLFMAKEG